MTMTRRDWSAYVRTQMLGTFQAAYLLHKRGMREVALLLDFDIQAAGQDTPEPVAKLHRRMIQSACGAVDAGVPPQEAAGVVNKLLAQIEDEIFKDRNWNENN